MFNLANGDNPATVAVFKIYFEDCSSEEMTVTTAYPAWQERLEDICWENLEYHGFDVDSVTNIRLMRVK